MRRGKTGARRLQSLLLPAIRSAGLLFFVLMTACATVGGGKTPVTGRVVDGRSSEPLRAAVVTVRLQDPREDEADYACEEVSNSRGEFNCEGLRDEDFEIVRFRPDTKYVLECKLPGYKSLITNFTYRSGLRPYDVRLVSAVSDGESEVTSANPPEIVVGGSEAAIGK